MTVEELKQWLLKKFDADKDGRISKEEVKELIRYTGTGHFASSWKCWRFMRSVDTNGDGFIDEQEFGNLVDFAKKKLGVKVVRA
ncbi:hypothetical protein FNV43_RR11852 [Rhamnella rubrinervis]|uniref:EF-hand domain-containing protein n=1 Tax=Rhamnella rubrinervis TaxID=2594499 RepID=A0A8K0H6A9_9ROSA|nr:hypothetical protein FNV43_RR11852 [Rhamnella rubrinervis]